MQKLLINNQFTCNNKIQQLLFFIGLKAYSDVEQQKLYTELKDIKVNIVVLLMCLQMESTEMLSVTMPEKAPLYFCTIG